jgi:ATP-dependent Clp protease protease subunit
MGRYKFKKSDKASNAHVRNTNSEMSVEDIVPAFQLSQRHNDRILYLSGEVSEFSISNIISELLALANENPTKPIYLVISTYGGSVDEMFSLYDTIKFLPCPVYTIGLGKVMSAGVLLLSSGHKGKRMIGRNARVMMHPISGGIFGTVFDAMNETKEFQRLQNLMVSCLEKETKISKNKIEEIMKAGHDFYLDPDKAVEYGIVDNIIGN